MSKKILCDMLGCDGRALMKNIINAHNKSLWRDRQKLQRVVDAVRFFKILLDKRREILLAKKKASIKKQINRSSHTWRTEYKKIMAEKRKEH